MDTFMTFCEYVDKTIFQKQIVGSYLSFVIDQSFFNSFCSKYNVSITSIAISATNHLHKSDILTIKGIIAIQVFAASKMKNEGDITAKNYRERLAGIFGWQIEDLQKWLKTRQDNVWMRFYDWCESQGFFIVRCEPRSNAWRYVQYPLAMSKGVFNTEDLLHIAESFVNHGLNPNEDISERNFWRIIDKYDVIKYIRTNHGKEVLEECYANPKQYLQQIYSFYAYWNGEYRKSLVQRQNSKYESNDFCLYLSDDFSQLDVRGRNLNLIYRFDTSDMNITKLQTYYRFKCEKGIILFEKDDIYDNYWFEKRFLDKNEKSVAIVFKQLTYKRFGLKNLFENKDIIVYEVVYKPYLHDLFADDRPYKLEGGLKVNRNTYIKGACPSLTVDSNVKFWLDRKMYEGHVNMSLNQLEEGSHTLMIHGYKPFDFNVIKPEILPKKWPDGYSKWLYDKKTKVWSCSDRYGIVLGLDFSFFANSAIDEHNTLKRWAYKMLNGTSFAGENNIGIKLIE